MIAACVGWAALPFAAPPADEEHPCGHAKAEYFPSALEGGMIVVAAAIIFAMAIERLLHLRFASRCRTPRGWCTSTPSKIPCRGQTSSPIDRTQIAAMML